MNDIGSHLLFWNRRGSAVLSKLSRGIVATLVVGLAALAFCSDMLYGFDRWGQYDWDLFFFHANSTYRSLVEFGEPPLWNPWYLGGFPMIGNPQISSLSPFFLFDLLVGPIVAIKLKILAHYAIGLGGMYWCCRQMGLSCLASVYAAGTFLFSTWLALHIHAGHQWCLAAAYVPWVVGMLFRGRQESVQAIYAGVVVALMVLEGGGAHIVSLLGIVCGLLALCWAIEQRSVRPLVALLLMGAFGAGLSAAKLLPAAKLLQEFPRHTSVGGSSWSRYKEAMSAGTPIPEEIGTVTGPIASDTSSEQSGTPPVEARGGTMAPQGNTRASRRDLPAFLFKIFLGRDQKCNVRYFPIQGHGWHEYGSYLGPLAIILLAGSPLVLRTAWPWIVIVAFCFLTAAGNFSRFAPWALMHDLPVLNNMRGPSRFLILFVFAVCVLAGMVIDEIRRRLASRRDGLRHWADFAAGLLVIAALIDSMIVGRASFQGIFPLVPPKIGPRQPAIATITGQKTHTTEAMLANYCVLDTEEVIPFPISVLPRDHPGYLGELYFVPDNAGREAIADRVELESWTPNAVRVRVTVDTSGFVVLNRNWEEGWTAIPPYRATQFRGLIAARAEPGSHSIAFSYRPRVFLVGMIVSLVTFILAAAWVLCTHFTKCSLPRHSG
jgi:hypothetical protein